MPKYAILGSTGNVGGSLLKILLDEAQQFPSKNICINAYCRSKQKLLKAHSEISNDSVVDVYEGSLDDRELLANCLQNTQAAFVAIALTGNQSQATLAVDTAHQVIGALEDLKSRNERLPKLVILSSASTEHRLMSSSPKWALSLLYTALSNIYDDLKAAEKIYREKDITSISFIKPGALSNDERKGHMLSLDDAVSPVSFLDLAAGMVDVADDIDGIFDEKAVAVNAAQKTAFPWDAPLNLIKGLLVHFFPWLYPYTG